MNEPHWRHTESAPSLAHCQTRDLSSHAGVFTKILAGTFAGMTSLKSLYVV